MAGKAEFQKRSRECLYGLKRNGMAGAMGLQTPRPLPRRYVPVNAGIVCLGLWNVGGQRYDKPDYADDGIQ